MEKSKNLIYIANNEEEVLHIFQMTGETSIEVFMKNVTYDNIKSHKEAEVYPLFRKYIFRKTTA